MSHTDSATFYPSQEMNCIFFSHANHFVLFRLIISVCFAMVTKNINASFFNVKAGDCVIYIVTTVLKG